MSGRKGRRPGAHTGGPGNPNQMSRKQAQQKLEAAFRQFAGIEGMAKGVPAARARVSAPTLRVWTECGATIYLGLFGKDEDGNHDECDQRIVVDVDDTPEERAAWKRGADYQDDAPAWDGIVVVRCAGCRTLLEWPQRWEPCDDQGEPLGGTA